MLPAPNEQSDDPEGFWLKVECAGRETLTFRRNAGVETVGGLKERLEREWGVPAGRQSLTCSVGA
ncbi:hypothetical protein M3Y99_01376600 [Aphelenchoides fujianensis]|nr:hypothetical protein M3Y99_01376600 [Aphelenchoides fujianensis]